jgi:hypothetical protein
MLAEDKIMMVESFRVEIKESIAAEGEDVKGCRAKLRYSRCFVS